MSRQSPRMVKAALVALAAGAAVAVANPARPIGHDVSTAMHDVALLTSGAAHAAGRRFLPRRA